MHVTDRIPASLARALRPVTLVVGHYGTGKTNFAVNLAVDLVKAGKHVTLIDLDIVNPYFRASEQRRVLEERGVQLVAPVFAEAGSSLDVPSLTGKISPAIELAGDDRYVILDVGGDDAGSVAVGRYARIICEREYAMLAVLNRFRNLVQDPVDAVENLEEIQAASHLQVTALIDNAHLKNATEIETIRKGMQHAQEVSNATNMPLACVTVPQHLADESGAALESFVKSELFYAVKMYVKTPWE